MFKYGTIVAIIYACVLFIDRLDVTIINVAMPTFAEVFKVRVTQTEWISTGFLLALAVVIPVSGWCGDKFSTKKVFIFATILYVLGSLLCALAWNLQALIIFRILQGIGGGMIVPVGMTMVYRAFPPSEYSKVASYTLMPTLIAPAIAPTIGGIILEYLNWHWIFLFNIPIGLTAIVLSIVYLKEENHHEISHPFDWVGFILVAAGLSSLLYTLHQFGHYGIRNMQVIVFGIMMLVSFLFFIYWEKRTKYPLVDLKFFRTPLFVQANLMQFSLQICYFGSMFLIAIYLQMAVGMTPIQCGLVMFTQPVGTILVLPFSARFFIKYGPKYPMIFGMIGLTLTTFLILIIRNPSDAVLAASLLFVRGLVIGFVNAPVQAAAMFDIEHSQTGVASSIFNAGRQVAISLGVAFSSLILASGFRDFNAVSSRIPKEVIISVFDRAFLVISVIAFLGVFIAMTIDNKRILKKIERGFLREDK